MLVYPQIRKITHSAKAERVYFLLVEAPAPTPDEQKAVLGNTAWSSGCAIENRYRERKIFVEDESVKITRQLILPA